MKHVVIFGAGAIGSALGKILKGKAHIEFWDANLKKVVRQKSLNEIVPNADFIFLCIPSWAMCNVIGALQTFLSKKTTFVSLAKGIEQHTNDTMDLLLKKHLPKNQPFALLGGAMLAHELLEGLSGMSVVASKSPVVIKAIRELFSKTSIYVESSNDVRGVALLGVLKNIYAMALGVSDGFGFGENTKGKIVSIATNEMVQLAKQLGGKRETALGMAGLGDFVATGFSSNSRNYQFGYAFAKKQNVALCEGAIALTLIPKLLNASIRQFVLLNALFDIIQRKKNGKKVFEKLFSRNNMRIKIR